MERKYITNLKLIKKWIDDVKIELMNLAVQVDRLIKECEEEK